MDTNASTSDMKTLASCINKLVLDGYTEDFKISESGMLSLHEEKLYKPEQVHVLDFFSGLKVPVTRQTMPSCMRLKQTMGSKAL